MSSNNSSDPDRSSKKQVKKAKNIQRLAYCSKGLGVAGLGTLLWLAITGHFNYNIKHAICLYLISATFLFFGSSLQNKHDEIIKALNKKHRCK
jgi:hypothetical protein